MLELELKFMGNAKVYVCDSTYSSNYNSACYVEFYDSDKKLIAVRRPRNIISEIEKFTNIMSVKDLCRLDWCDEENILYADSYSDFIEKIQELLLKDKGLNATLEIVEESLIQPSDWINKFGVSTYFAIDRETLIEKVANIIINMNE